MQDEQRPAVPIELEVVVDVHLLPVRTNQRTGGFFTSIQEMMPLPVSRAESERIQLRLRAGVKRKESAGSYFAPAAWASMPSG